MKKFITWVLAVVCVVASVIGLAGCFSSTEETKVLSTPTGLRIDGGCLCWNPVDNAVKYTVSIDGAEDISEDTKYSVEKVKDGEHIFKVKANGDGLIFLSSGFSDELKVSLVGGSLSSEGYYSQFDELTKKESFLGYGFDVIESSVFSDKHVKTSFPIFNTDKLMEQRLLKVDSKQSNVEETQASSIEEFMQSWNAKANVDVSWGKKRIGGSVGVEAHYEGGVENAKSKYFHCISINNQKFYIVLQSDLDTYRNILNEGFVRDLYSDMEPAELFKNYGTHFITSAVMGGKINSYYLYSSEEEQSYHDVSAKVSVEVRYLVGETDVEVSGGYRQYASEKNVYIKNTLEVIGGGDHGMLSDADIGAKYADWEKSLNEHASLMGIKDSSSLIPIWKLIDASKDTKTYSWNYGNDGENSFIGEGSRAQQLQAYFDAYGIDSYNSLMKAAGLPEIKSAEAIQDIKINNNKPSDNGAYAVYAGARNAISFTVKPDDATGYTKGAIISEECEYAEIINDKEGLAVKIAANAPANTTIDLVVSAGSVSEVVKLRIHKEHDVIFNSNGGSSVEKITVEHDSQIDEPTAPTKDGFYFKGWYTDPNFAEDSRFAFGSQAITENLTLYAKWSDAFTNTSIMYVKNANETVDGQKTKGEFIVKDGGVTEVSYKVTQLGSACSKTYEKYYDFLGWYTSAANGIQLTDENGVLLKNVSGYTDKNGKWIYQESDSVTLYAYWKQSYSDYTYISNAQEFVKISENPSGKYMLIDDISLGEIVPIGTYYWTHVVSDIADDNASITPFTGELNGTEHSITYSMSFTTFDSTSAYSIGLFATSDGAVFKNLKVNAQVVAKGKAATGYCAIEVSVGGLVGTARNTEFNNIEILSDSKIENNETDRVELHKDIITGLFKNWWFKGALYAGGIVGDARDCAFGNCNSYAEVYAQGWSAYAGGIAGNAYNTQMEYSCNNFGTVESNCGIYENNGGEHSEENVVFGKTTAPWFRKDGTTFLNN